MELRTIDSKHANVRIEKRADGKRYISGYAAVFYRDGDTTTEYQLYRDLYERVMKGAFKEAVKEDDVRALMNHDPNMLLARSGNGLTLREDEVGLFYEFPIDENDPDHLRVAAKLERGDMSGSSFGFEVVERRFLEFKDFDVVELAKVRLYDVSPCTFPAYEGTSVGIRSTDGIEAIVKERDAWKQSKKQTEVDTLDIQKRQAMAEAGIL
jgi:hypothetical protein